MGCDRYQQPLCFLLHFSTGPLSLQTTMLDVITLFTAVNIQSELEQANVEKGENLQALVVNKEDSGNEGNLIEDAAERLSTAFDAFEGAVASSVSMIFGVLETEPAPRHQP